MINAMSKHTEEYWSWLCSISDMELYREQLRLENSTDIMEGEKAEMCESAIVERFKNIIENGGARAPF